MPTYVIDKLQGKGENGAIEGVRWDMVSCSKVRHNRRIDISGLDIQHV